MDGLKCMQQDFYSEFDLGSEDFVLLEDSSHGSENSQKKQTNPKIF